MNRTATAIREAAERGGYGYCWWKANDIEDDEGYNAMPMRRHYRRFSPLDVRDLYPCWIGRISFSFPGQPLFALHWCVGPSNPPIPIIEVAFDVHR